MTDKWLQRHTPPRGENRPGRMSGTTSFTVCRKYDLKPARFYYWKDTLLNSAPEIFENRGRNVDEDHIRAQKDREIERLKATIAEIVQEDLEIKKKIGERLRGRGQI